MIFPIVIATAGALGSGCTNGPCAPFNDHCGAPFVDAPKYHLMDQHGCGEVMPLDNSSSQYCQSVRVVGDVLGCWQGPTQL